MKHNLLTLRNLVNMTSPLLPFHIAFPVHSIEAARAFYGVLLGCAEGRSASDWVDFNLYGHQIVAHLAPGEASASSTNAVDGHGVPVRHFGALLTMAQWTALAEKLKAVGTQFLIEPYIRFKGEPGEQATMFFLDPSGNALEFKSFANLDMVFMK
jgi:extradiol dioxygenase family protein